MTRPQMLDCTTQGVGSAAVRAALAGGREPVAHVTEGDVRWSACPAEQWAGRARELAAVAVAWQGAGTADKLRIESAHPDVQRTSFGPGTTWPAGCDDPDIGAAAAGDIIDAWQGPVLIAAADGCVVAGPPHWDKWDDSLTAHGGRVIG